MEALGIGCVVSASRRSAREGVYPRWVEAHELVQKDAI